jgi:hypothetical protein
MPSSTNTSCYPPEVASLFERLWASDDIFSKKIDEVRASMSKQRAQADASAKFLETIRADNERLAKAPPAISIAPHPIFDRAKFVTNLPTEEVEEQLTLVLQLATMFLTNARALEWFAHVRHASRVVKGELNGHELSVLEPPSTPITTSMINSVRQEIRDLAGRVKVTFLGSFPTTRGTVAIFLPTVPEMYLYLSRMMQESLLRSSLSHLNDAFAPSIWLSWEFLASLLRHRHGKIPPSDICALQFFMSEAVLHEFAHAWVEYCHPQVSRFEPLIFPGEILMEAGISWESFMFGARIIRYETMFQHILASDIHTQYGEPRFSIHAIIPHKWLNRWFQQRTWTNGKFSRLHRAGKLLAPSPDRSVKHFHVWRYCNTQKSWFTCIYRAGKVADQPCCDNESYSTKEPGTTTMWPDDPAEVRRMYFEILEKDQELARAHGVDGLGGCNGGTMRT